MSATETTAAGPLVGLKVLEFAGLGPAPFCAMLLSDLGADVLRIDRPGTPSDDCFDFTHRGRRSVALDLKRPEGRDAALALSDRADVLLEGFRPGVMERLDLGPQTLLARHPSLVYGRMTGWGQDGPLAQAPGHDLNYIALAGALHGIGPHDQPAIPLNLVGDFGGGALYLAVGVLAALLHVREGGPGQVVDAAMVDGTASLLSMIFGFHARGVARSSTAQAAAVEPDVWLDRRASNVIDGGAHFYNTYACADGRHIAVAAIEPAFYAELLRLTGLSLPADHDPMDRASWPERRARMADLFRRRTRDEWCALLEGSEACFAPVLSLAETPEHPQHRARGTFVEVEGVLQPGPAPRLSITPGRVQGPPPGTGEHNDTALLDWGFSEAEAARLRSADVFGRRSPGAGAD